MINIFAVFKGYEIEPKLKAATEGRFWLIFWQKYQSHLQPRCSKLSSFLLQLNFDFHITWFLNSFVSGVSGESSCCCFVDESTRIITLSSIERKQSFVVLQISEYIISLEITVALNSMGWCPFLAFKAQVWYFFLAPDRCTTEGWWTTTQSRPVCPRKAQNYFKELLKKDDQRQGQDKAVTWLSLLRRFDLMDSSAQIVTLLIIE